MTNDQPPPVARVPGQHSLRRHRLIAMTLTVVAASTVAAAVVADAQAGRPPSIQAMGITLLDEDCERTRTGCDGGGGGGGGGGDPIPVGGCNPQLTQQSVSRGSNPELGGAYSRVAFGAKWVCSSGVNIASIRVRTELWDRTQGKRVSVVAMAQEVTSVNFDSSASIDLYDIDYYPAAQLVEVVLLVEVDAGPGRIWQCQDAGVVPWYWCEGEGTRRLSAVMGFNHFNSNLQNPKPNYVALGDSVSAGSGAGSYDTGGGGIADPLVGEGCLRSKKSYPRLVSKRHPGIINIGFAAVALGRTWERPWGVEGHRACHGAVIWDVHVPGGTNKQIDAVTTDTKLVTITVGANNLGFDSKLHQCIDADCGNPLVTQVELNSTRIELTRLYQAIRSKMKPDGKLVVLTYPKFFPLAGPLSSIRCPLTAQKITEPEVTRINDAWNQANQMIREAVQATNDPNVVLLDAIDAFNGHDICSSTPWANGVWIDPVSGNTNQSFHPNAAGYAQLANMLEQKLKQIGILPQ